VTLSLVTLVACDVPFVPEAPDDSSLLEGPIDGLSAAERATFVRGDGEFGRRFTPADGLGPVFIAQSCDACHAGDGKGHPLFDITRFGRATGGGFDPLAHLGGPQLQNRAIAGHRPESLPSVANVSARFTPPAVTGLGLLEGVDDAILLALADSADRDGDGISGRVSWIEGSASVAELAERARRATSGEGTRFLAHGGKYIGRFGKKATTLSLEHQTVTAYSEDMGLTTDLLPQELLNGGVAGSSGDDVADPEVGTGIVSNVVFYLRTLRPPPRRAEENGAVAAGRALFGQAGCSACHRPVLRTGRSSVGPLNEVEFHPYTDLLLHDMGPDLDDGYTEGNATSREWRTAPLWGIGLAERSQGGLAFHLHDGRARSLREAIGSHGGEGAPSRARFQQLSPAQQEELLAFLRSL